MSFSPFLNFFSSFVEVSSIKLLRLANHKVSPQSSLVTCVPAMMYVPSFTTLVAKQFSVQVELWPKIRMFVFSCNSGASVHDPLALTRNCLFTVQFMTSFPNGPCLKIELTVQLIATKATKLLLKLQCKLRHIVSYYSYNNILTKTVISIPIESFCSCLVPIFAIWVAWIREISFCKKYGNINK